VTIQRANLANSPQSIEVTGIVQSELEAPLAARLVARVRSVLVNEGDRVRRGEPLVLLDTRDLDASVAQAAANLRAADVGYDNAQISARMEDSISAARISEAQSKIAQSEAAVQAAAARLDLIQAGPRRQEREQAILAVAQAMSSFTLAERNLKRMGDLYAEGAISAQQYDQTKAQFEVAKSQLDTARQGKSMSDEGSRPEDIRAAQQAVRQAQAAVQEARAGLKTAEAGALQAAVRQHEVIGAQAQIRQSEAGLELARTARDFSLVTAPFEGIVAKRLVDPGAMAAPGSLLVVVYGGALRLEAVVPESALEYVHIGDAISVRFDALRGRATAGRIAEIGPKGDAASHTFIVKIGLPNANRAAPGMFGRARITIGMERRLLVPASAVSDREGLHYVFVVDEKQFARLRMVTVGDVAGGRVPVLSGLSAGEQIVSSGADRIADGTAVFDRAR
jgi:RND family efflux transporter MFP subunit